MHFSWFICATLSLLVMVVTPSFDETATALELAIGQQFEVTGVTLAMTAQRSTGPCTTTVLFSGQITVNGKGTVSYSFGRSDGASSEARTLDFEAAGSKTVTSTWTLHNSKTSYEGWQVIRILAPSSITSDPARFTYVCDRSEKQSEPILNPRSYYYIGPRSYPDNTLDEEARVSAFTRLNATRLFGNRPHVNSEYLESPQSPDQRGSNGCAWYATGPTNINGRVTSIAIDPHNNKRVFLTSVGGIWRSKDGGRRWQRVSDDFLASVFASIAINPVDGNDVLAGGGEPNYHDTTRSGIGVWRSVEGGDSGSWVKVSPPELDGQVIYRIRIDPVPPNNIYIATSRGVYLGIRDANNNIGWNRLAGFDGHTTDLVVDFSSPSREIYAGVALDGTAFGCGIWKYAGAAWRRCDSGINSGTSGIIALALAAKSNVLYAKVADKNTGQLLGVYRTESGGEAPSGANAWTYLPAASVINDSCADAFCYSWYNSVIEVDPRDANVLYCGGMNLYKSKDGGQSWAKVSDGRDSSYPLQLHADQHAVAFDPQNNNIVYVGNDGGIYKSSDLSAATWRWNNISHGLMITEFYRIASQQATATMLVGGAQDNGTMITFGNRTWYNPGGCDGADVAVDGRNGDTVYANCNGGLYELANPVPGTPGGQDTIVWSIPPDTLVNPPLVTDDEVPGAALAAGVQAQSDAGPQVLLKTLDGVKWTKMGPVLPSKLRVSFIAIAPSSSFQVYYVGLSSNDGSIPPTIWETADGGLTWFKTPVGLPSNLRPNACAVDHRDPKRTFAAFGGKAGGSICISTNGGQTWSALLGDNSGVLKSTAITGIVLDPYDSNILYVSTQIGVFKGHLGTGPLFPTSWVPFDEGLPNGVDVNAIWINRSAGKLSIGTMGHGTYQRDIRPGNTCSGAMLLVRDNVFDNGSIPSPNNIPDPEHPIPDSGRKDFYRPNDTPAGQVYWWTSPDIRFEVPSNTSSSNVITDPDHVEFESCPIEARACPPGTVQDSALQPGRPATVYVQVTNRGFRSASTVRVLALWASAESLAFPRLPDSFWNTTFPAGTSECGRLDTSTGWNFIDSLSPCKVIPVINPDVPEVVGFHWVVPDSLRSACVLVIVESPDDPINNAVRSTNETLLYELVPKNRQIGLRNLQIVSTSDASSLVERLNISAPTSSGGPVDMIISRNAVDQDSRFALLLPNMSRIESSGGKIQIGDLYPKFRKSVQELNLNSKLEFTIDGFSGRVTGITIPTGKTEKIGLAYGSRRNHVAETDTRITFLLKQGDKVLGGITYVLRR